MQRRLIMKEKLIGAKPSKDNGKNKWSLPFPKIFLFNGERYKILKAEISNVRGEIGMVLNDNFEIGCINKSIKIISTNVKEKNTNINEFIRNKDKKGKYLI